jgi:hypothetical protein
MKKIIATTLAALMLASVSVGVAVQPAAAISYTVHIGSPMMHKHHKHWHPRHRICITHWRHHHPVRVCYWVPGHW